MTSAHPGPADSTMVPGHRPLGGTGLQVGAIGLGCVTFGREIDAASAAGVLERALELGVNLLDTAEAYADGASERVLGQLLRPPGVRTRVLVCTKVNGELTPARIRQCADESLARLGLETIDLYLLHNYDVNHSLEPALAALDGLVVAGKVRYIGCSNFSAEQLARALAQQTANGWTRFSVLQPMYNLVARRVEKELLPLCRQENIGVLAYSPLGAGFLTGKYTLDAPLPHGSRFALKPGHCRHYFFPRSFAFVSKLQAVAHAAGVPPTRLALAWMLTRADVSSVLVGARSSRHIDEAVAAWREREPLAPYLDQLTRASAEFVD